MKVQTTTKYFGMSADDLSEAINDYGYTREECKILDEGLEVTFFEHRKSIDEKDIKEYTNRTRMELKAILRTTDNRYAVIFN